MVMEVVVFYFLEDVCFCFGLILSGVVWNIFDYYIVIKFVCDDY